MEMDGSLGQVPDALEETGVRRQSGVLFISDNGLRLSSGNPAERTPYREGKSTAFDGSIRSARVMGAPGLLQPGTMCSWAFCSIDLLPTLAACAGAPLPSHSIVGQNVWESIRSTRSGQFPSLYSITNGKEFQAFVTGDGRWNLLLPPAYRTLGALQERTESQGATGRKRSPCPFSTFGRIRWRPRMSRENIPRVSSALNAGRENIAIEGSRRKSGNDCPD